MKFKIRNDVFESTIIVLLVPFLSIPVIGLLLRKKNQWGSVLISLLFGFVAYLYIPSITNDKARYYERYEAFKNFSFEQFFEFLGSIKKPDFVFDFLIFLFAKIGLPLDFAFFILTFCALICIFKIVNTIVNLGTRSNYSYLFVCIFVICSFSLPSLLSGLRFTLGASLFSYGVFKLLFEKKNSWGVLYLLTAVQTHFSLLFFVPALLILYFDKQRHVNYRILFLISFLFFLIPSSVTGQLLSFFSISESLDAKTSVYVDEDDFVSQNFDTNQSSILVYILRTLWYYVMLLYLLVFHKKSALDLLSTHLLTFLYVCIFLVNFTYPFTTIFSRLTLFVKFIFLFYILYEYFISNTRFSRHVVCVMFTFYLLTLLIDINILRVNLVESLFNSNSLTSLHILFKKITPDDFIQ